MTYKPVVLSVLDGYGVAAKVPKSTWSYARRPNFEQFEKTYPFTTLQASGIAVGLPWGEDGNSEVGHLTMGAGRVIYTHLPRIIMAIQDGSFFENPAFKKAAEHVKKNNSRMHILGLFSSGSVHAYPDHLYALLEFASKNEIKELYLHLFTDGRDSPRHEAGNFFSFLETRLSRKYPFAKIASVMGRNYAMDRGERWAMVERAYNLLTLGKGNSYENISLYIEKNYEKGLVDDLVEPGFLSEGDSPLGRIKDGDAAVFFNYREDSARELTGTFVSEGFDKFPREKVKNLLFVTMTEYDPRFPVEVAFKPLGVKTPLAKIVSDAGLKQLHVAETEKYAHVTYFFNGGRESPFPGEDRILVPSPSVDGFNKTPEMSAEEVTDKVLGSLEKYDFILVNFSNADMVGHTGDFYATVKAIEAVDKAVGRIARGVLGTGGALVVVGDHGNAEEKIYRQSAEKRTKHTDNPVPFFIIADGFESDSLLEPEEVLKKYSAASGALTDVAPTILDLLGLEKPQDMLGISLIQNIK